MKFKPMKADKESVNLLDPDDYDCWVKKHKPIPCVFIKVLRRSKRPRKANLDPVLYLPF